MPRVKIDKKALKENELESFILNAREYVTQNPKQIFIPLIVVIVLVVGTIVTTRYFNEQNKNAEGQLFQAQITYRTALNSTDKSSEIVGIQQSLTNFKRIASENSMTKMGKVAGVYIGDCYFHLGQYDDAIKYYREGISKNPPKLTAAWAQMSIGYGFARKSDYKSALVEFEKVTKDYPDSFLVPSAKLQMGYCYEKQNDLAKAKETYEFIVKTYKDSNWKGEAEARLAVLTGSVVPPTSG
jgi:tetratricopeptide (TPR) repeat protein